MATRKKTATKVTKEEEEVLDNLFITERGMTIECKRIDPVFLQAVISSVTMPEVPTYEAKVGFSGRTETHRMDALSAEQTDGGEETWRKYIEELTAATNAQTEVSLKALFLDGTVRPEADFIDREWERRMNIIGVKLLEDPDALWVQYLSMSLTTDDIINLSTKIMRMTGVAEEVIQEAEDSFRDSVLTDE